MVELWLARLFWHIATQNGPFLVWDILERGFFKYLFQTGKVSTYSKVFCCLLAPEKNTPRVFLIQKKEAPKRALYDVSWRRLKGDPDALKHIIFPWESHFSVDIITFHRPESQFWNGRSPLMVIIPVVCLRLNLSFLSCFFLHLWRSTSTRLQSDTMALLSPWWGPGTNPGPEAPQQLVPPPPKYPGWLWAPRRGGGCWKRTFEIQIQQWQNNLHLLSKFGPVGFEFFSFVLPSLAHKRVA